MKKNLLVGILLGIVLIYLSVRGIRLQDVAAGFRATRKDCLILSLVFMFFVQVLRTIRWGAILRPLEYVASLPLFSVTSVGFLAIVALPARIGELVRPYLITTRSGIKLSSALATVVMERIFDGLSVMAILATILFFMPLPPWMLRAAGLFLIFTLAVLSAAIALVYRREAALRMMQPVLERLPSRFIERLDRLVRSFSEGLLIIDDGRGLLLVLFLSLMIWLVNAGTIYVLFSAFGFHLPPVAAFTLMIVLILGIAIPTAPGFIGNWHFACILGLGLFGVPRPEALTFAIVYHALSVGIVIALGLVFLPFNRFSLAELKGTFSKVG